jgi:hypothetical protein
VGAATSGRPAASSDPITQTRTAGVPRLETACRVLDRVERSGPRTTLSETISWNQSPSNQAWTYRWQRRRKVRQVAGEFGTRCFGVRSNE